MLGRRRGEWPDQSFELVEGELNGAVIGSTEKVEQRLVLCHPSSMARPGAGSGLETGEAPRDDLDRWLSATAGPHISPPTVPATRSTLWADFGSGDRRGVGWAIVVGEPATAALDKETTEQ